MKSILDESVFYLFAHLTLIKSMLLSACTSRKLTIILLRPTVLAHDILRDRSIDRTMPRLFFTCGNCHSHFSLLKKVLIGLNQTPFFIASICSFFPRNNLALGARNLSSSHKPSQHDLAK